MVCKPMKLGRKPTFILMMLLTSSFFFVEVIVGYITRSMALVADSFHMLSDVISLIVGFYSLQLARRNNDNPLDGNTFGWVRAEVLGALVNAVFLVALCLSIFISALKRVAEPQPLINPQLIIIVGAVGLVINLVGMLLFHDHAGHGHSHGGGHTHSHGKKEKPTQKNDETHCEAGKRITVGGCQITSYEKEDFKALKIPGCADKNGKDMTYEYAIQNDASCSIDYFQDGKNADGKNNEIRDLTIYLQQTGNENHIYTLQEEGIEVTKKEKSGQMNMKGVYLHILADAVGSIIVIIAALIVLYVKQGWVVYVDPVLSMVMVLIILYSIVPLLKESSQILLQNVPNHIQLRQLEKRLLNSFPEIIAVHEFHVWQLAGSKIVASLHLTFSSNADYRQVSPFLKEFFHHEGIHSTTFQPEYDEGKELDSHQCLLACPSKTCEQKLCCSSPKTSPGLVTENEILTDEMDLNAEQVDRSSLNSSKSSRSASIEIKLDELDKDNSHCKKIVGNVELHPVADTDDSKDSHINETFENC